MKKFRIALYILIPIFTILASGIYCYYSFIICDAEILDGKPVENVITFRDSVIDPSRVTQVFDSIITRSFDSIGMVGAAVAVVKDGRIELLKPMGVRKFGTSDSVDIHTIFRVASVSKGFAGILGGILNNNHTLCLDDKVADYLPDFKLKSDKATKSISLRNVLSQSTGLEAHAYDNFLNQSMPYDYIYKNLNKLNMCGEPGKYYGYQNVIYSLYDPVVEKKTNISYAQLLRDSLFRPLHMDDASTGFEAFCSNENIAYPHKRNRTLYISQELNPRYYSALPAAGVNASISDMSKWLMAMMGNNETVINKDVLDTVFTPRIETRLKRGYFGYWQGLQSRFYGLGWMVLCYKGNQIIYHRGFIDGYKAEIAFCREKNVGIVYLTNSPNCETYNWIPLFFDMYL